MSERIPDDVLALVFQHLSLNDFCAAAGTCRVWHAAARKKAAWPKTIGYILFNLQSVRGVRKLSQTAWAACARVTLPGYSNSTDLREWIVHVGDELVCVSDLSLVRNEPMQHLLGMKSWSSLLGRLTSLRTNRIELVQATSRERLSSLTIARPVMQVEEWTCLLPALESLTHIRLEEELHSFSFGRALATLTKKHRKLKSVELPYRLRSSQEVLRGTLHCHSDLDDFSSILTLTHAPRGLATACIALARLPSLVIYACAPPPQFTSHISLLVNPHAHTNLVSLALDSFNARAYQRLEPYMRHLVEFSIYRHMDHYSGPLGSFSCLRLLRLPPRYLSFATQDMTCLAPRLEQLSICESMMWLRHGPRAGVSPCVKSLSTLPHFQHLELRTCTDPQFQLVDAGILTRTLFHGMESAHQWTEVTCSVMPVSLVANATFVSFVSKLASMRWHVIQDDGSKTVTYRPRLRISRWRAWVLGLHPYQVFWDRV
jgi:hypothetical protein